MLNSSGLLRAGMRCGVFFAAAMWVACGHVAEAQSLHANNGSYELQVLVDGAPAQRFTHQGEDYVLGREGARYTVRVLNHSSRRIEAVVSVDGLDVVDGKRGDISKRGYLVPAWGSVDIDGWRLSERRAAAFRFSSVADSYAAATGSARNVGVIGAAIFPERYIAPPRALVRPRREASEYRQENATGYDLGARDTHARSSSAAAEHSAAADVSTAEGKASAPSASPPSAVSASPPSATKRRRGLGTEFGEAVDSQVHEVEFVRASARAPSHLLGVRYNDRDGLIAMGVELEPRCDFDCRERELRQSATPFPVSYRPYAAPPRGWRGDSR